MNHDKTTTFSRILPSIRHNGVSTYDDLIHSRHHGEDRGIRDYGARDRGIIIN